jgi:8-oxo-dGTP pyrophosphatase MutT (NUDIX family)
MEITRHFTATTFIVRRDRVLLHLHKKLGIWLPVGGHIDRDELPEEAARREAMEETGLQVRLHHADRQIEFADGARHLHRPAHLLLENINPFHQHIDFIYYATVTGGEFVPEDGGPENYHWFTAEELESDAWVLPENARVLALEALALLGEAVGNNE